MLPAAASRILDVILAILMVQFVGVPFSLLFGNLAGLIGTKRTILVGLAAYTLATFIAYDMETTTEFYLLALLIGLVQGGTQALSRSLFASMIPRHRTSEFFGFYSSVRKGCRYLRTNGLQPDDFIDRINAAGSAFADSIFLIGAVLLMLVDEEKGREEALRVEERVS